MRRALLLAALMVGISLASPVHARDPTPDADTWVEADWTITGVRLDAFDVDGTLRVHEAEVLGEVRTADGIRSDHRQAEEEGEGEQFRSELEAAVRGEVEEALARFFPDGDRVIDEVRLVEESLEADDDGDPYHPTVDFAIEASVETDLPGDGPDAETRRRALDALTMGASTTIAFDLPAEAGTNHTVALELPSEVRAIGDTPATLHATVENWNGTTVVSSRVAADVTGANATRFDRADGTVTVRVDLHDVAVDLLGGTGTVQADLRVGSEIRSLELPDTLRDHVPPGVRLDAVGADGIRLAIERGYLPEDWADRARDRFEQRATDAIRSAFGPDVPVEVALDETTVTGGVRGRPDADPPLVLEANARTQEEIPLFGGGPDRATLTVTTLDRSFAIDSFPPFASRYEVVLPEGLTLESADVRGGEVEQTTIDGRDALVVTLDPDQEATTATMSMGVTPGLLAGASPLVAIGVLVAAAAVVVVVVRTVAGRREGARTGKPEG